MVTSEPDEGTSEGKRLSGERRRFKEFPGIRFPPLLLRILFCNRLYLFAKFPERILEFCIEPLLISIRIRQLDRNDHN